MGLSIISATKIIENYTDVCLASKNECLSETFENHIFFWSKMKNSSQNTMKCGAKLKILWKEKICV